MSEGMIDWIKGISFLLTIVISFQIGRHFERSRLLKFLTKQGDRIEEVLDEFFSPPLGPDHDAQGLPPWEITSERKILGGRTEKKYFLS